MIPTKFDYQCTDILRHFKITSPILLGKGDQAWVYEYTNGKVLKIYRKTTQNYLSSLKGFENRLSTFDLPFKFPEIYETGFLDGLFYTVEKKLEGNTLSKIFQNLTEKDKQETTIKYFDALKYLQKVEFPELNFGQVLITGEEITAISWSEFIDKKLTQRTNLVRKYLEKDVEDLNHKIDLMRKVFKEKLQFSQKILVHGDYFYNNVLFNDKINLTAILDFSNSTVIGDYRMDIACSIMYFDLDEKYIKFLWELAVKNYSEEIIPIIKYYTAYQAFFQTESCLYNEGLYKWCLNHLNSAELWKFIESNLK